MGIKRQTHVIFSFTLVYFILILAQTSQETTSRRTRNHLHTTNLCIQAKAFRPIDLKCLFFGLIRCSLVSSNLASLFPDLVSRTVCRIVFQTIILKTANTEIFGTPSSVNNLWSFRKSFTFCSPSVLRHVVIFEIQLSQMNEKSQYFHYDSRNIEARRQFISLLHNNDAQ